MNNIDFLLEQLARQLEDCSRSVLLVASVLKPSNERTVLIDAAKGAQEAAEKVTTKPYVYPPQECSCWRLCEAGAGRQLLPGIRCKARMVDGAEYFPEGSK